MKLIVMILAVFALMPTPLRAEPTMPDLQKMLMGKFDAMNRMDQGIFHEDITPSVESYFPVGQPISETKKILAAQHLGALRPFKGNNDPGMGTMFVSKFDLTSHTFSNVYVVLDFDYDGSGPDMKAEADEGVPTRLAHVAAMDTISVHYTPLTSTKVAAIVGLGEAYHMALVYTDSKGRSYGASSGPSNLKTAQKPSFALTAIVASANGVPSAFGTLVSDPANNHPFTIGRPDDYYTQDDDGNPYPATTVLTGRDLSAKWQMILRTYVAVGKAEADLFADHPELEQHGRRGAARRRHSYPVLQQDLVRAGGVYAATIDAGGGRDNGARSDGIQLQDAAAVTSTSGSRPSSLARPLTLLAKRSLPRSVRSGGRVTVTFPFEAVIAVRGSTSGMPAASTDATRSVAPTIWARSIIAAGMMLRICSATSSSRPT